MDSVKPNEILDKQDFCSAEAKRVWTLTSNMKFYPPDSYHIDDCFHSILRLARKNDIGTGSVPFISYYMNQRLGSYNICATACDIYYEIARRNDSNRICCEDSVPVIVKALGKFVQTPEFCERALAVICEINGGDLRLWRRCAESDCFPLFMTILKNHKTWPDLCRYACNGLVKMLASPHPDLANPNYVDADRVFSDGGVGVLIGIMDYHFSREEVCIYASKAIEYITGLCSNSCVDCVKAGIVPIILDIIDKKKNATLVESVCTVMSNISDYDLIGGEDVKETIPVLIKALKEHVYSTNICSALSLTLLNIMGRNVDCVQKDTTTEALVAVQDIHVDNAKIIADTGKVLHLIAVRDTGIHPHKLSPVSHQGYCDICKSLATQFMGCRDCDYDECLLCNGVGS